MAFTINIYYTGTDGSARKFAEEMKQSGLAQKVRAEKGNLRYEYFFPMDDPETVLPAYKIVYRTLEKVGNLNQCRIIG